MSTRTGVIVLIGFALIAGCGEDGSFAGSQTTSAEGTTSTFTETTWGSTETTALYCHPFISQLPVMIRGNIGAAIGTIGQLEGPFVGEPPDEGAVINVGRTYWIIDLNVEEVVDGSFDRAVNSADNPLPVLAPEASTRILLFPDLEATPLGDLQLVADGATPVMLFLGGSGLGDSEEPGIWFLYRVATIQDSGVTFLGACTDELQTEMADLADALDRPADVDLLVDFQAETLANYFEPENPGPIEATAYSLYETEPPPPEGP